MEKCKDCKWLRENSWCQHLGITHDPESDPCEKFDPHPKKEKEERDERKRT